MFDFNTTKLFGGFAGFATRAVEHNTVDRPALEKRGGGIFREGIRLVEGTVLKTATSARRRGFESLTFHHLIQWERGNTLAALKTGLRQWWVLSTVKPPAHCISNLIPVIQVSQIASATRLGRAMTVAAFNGSESPRIGRHSEQIGFGLSRDWKDSVNGIALTPESFKFKDGMPVGLTRRRELGQCSAVTDEQVDRHVLSLGTNRRGGCNQKAVGISPVAVTFPTAAYLEARREGFDSRPGKGGVPAAVGSSLASLT